MLAITKTVGRVPNREFINIHGRVIHLGIHINNQV